MNGSGGLDTVENGVVIGCVPLQLRHVATMADPAAPVPRLVDGTPRGFPHPTRRRGGPLAEAAE